MIALCVTPLPARAVAPFIRPRGQRSTSKVDSTFPSFVNAKCRVPPRRVTEDERRRSLELLQSKDAPALLRGRGGVWENGSIRVGAGNTFPYHRTTGDSCSIGGSGDRSHTCAMGHLFHRPPHEALEGANQIKGIGSIRRALWGFSRRQDGDVISGDGMLRGILLGGRERQVDPLESSRASVAHKPRGSAPAGAGPRVLSSTPSTCLPSESLRGSRRSAACRSDPRTACTLVARHPGRASAEPA